MYCYLGVESPNTAKRHVNQLMARMGYADLSVQTGKGAVARFFCKLFSMFNLLSKLKAGDVLVIIEAMKMMSQVACDRDGTVLRFLVENGDTVEYDQPLIEFA